MNFEWFDYIFKKMGLKTQEDEKEDDNDILEFLGIPIQEEPEISHDSSKSQRELNQDIQELEEYAKSIKKTKPKPKKIKKPQIIQELSQGIPEEIQESIPEEIPEVSQGTQGVTEDIPEEFREFSAYLQDPQGIQEDIPEESQGIPEEFREFSAYMQEDPQGIQEDISEEIPEGFHEYSAVEDIIQEDIPEESQGIQEGIPEGFHEHPTPQYDDEENDEEDEDEENIPGFPRTFQRPKPDYVIDLTEEPSQEQVLKKKRKRLRRMISDEDDDADSGTDPKHTKRRTRQTKPKKHTKVDKAGDGDGDDDDEDKDEDEIVHITLVSMGNPVIFQDFQDPGKWKWGILNRDGSVYDNDGESYNTREEAKTVAGAYLTQVYGSKEDKGNQVRSRLHQRLIRAWLNQNENHVCSEGGEIGTEVVQLSVQGFKDQSYVIVFKSLDAKDIQNNPNYKQMSLDTIGTTGPVSELKAMKSFVRTQMVHKTNAEWVRLAKTISGKLATVKAFKVAGANEEKKKQMIETAKNKTVSVKLGMGFQLCRNPDESSGVGIIFSMISIPSGINPDVFAKQFLDLMPDS